MSEFLPEYNEKPFQELAEAVAGLGLGIVAYRDFIGRKKAQLAMEGLGIDASGDEFLETALTDVFATCVVTGMTLIMRGETDDRSFDNNVTRLTDSLPEEVQSSIGRFIPYFVDQGMDFQINTRASDPLRQKWDAEYKLLHSIDHSE